MSANDDLQLNIFYQQAINIQHQLSSETRVGLELNVSIHGLPGWVGSNVSDILWLGL